MLRGFWPTPHGCCHRKPGENSITVTCICHGLKFYKTQNQCNNDTSSYFFPLKHMGTCKTRLVTDWFVVHTIPENVDIINCQRKTISNFSVSQTIPWPPRCKW